MAQNDPQETLGPLLQFDPKRMLNVILLNITDRCAHSISFTRAVPGGDGAVYVGPRPSAHFAAVISASFTSRGFAFFTCFSIHRLVSYNMCEIDSRAR